jgi:hypothetical protein
MLIAVNRLPCVNVRLPFRIRLMLTMPINLLFISIGCIGCSLDRPDREEKLFTATASDTALISGNARIHGHNPG